MGSPWADMGTSNDIDPALLDQPPGRVHASPVKWSVADLNAEESKVLLETIELSYHYFNIIKKEN